MQEASRCGRNLARHIGTFILPTNISTVVKYGEWFCRVLQQHVFLVLVLGDLGLLHGLVNEHRALRQQVPFRVAMVAGSDFDVDVAAPPTARHL
jgi:hypothetical protein